jgi:hypothetical protein
VCRVRGCNRHRKERKTDCGKKRKANARMSDETREIQKDVTKCKNGRDKETQRCVE